MYVTSWQAQIVYAEAICNGFFYFLILY